MAKVCSYCNSNNTVPYEPGLNKERFLCLTCNRAFVIYKVGEDELSANMVDDRPTYHRAEGSTEEYKQNQSSEKNISFNSFTDSSMRRYFSGNRKKNLCSYFILPLMNINCKSFGPGFFINSYLSPCGMYIFVLLKRGYYMDERFTWVRYVSGVFTDGRGKQMLKLKIPEGVIGEVQLFIQGRYSKMDGDAALKIWKRSGLRRKPQPDYRLLALNKCAELRSAMEKFLDVKLSEHAELLSVPSASSFLIENRLSDPDYFINMVPYSTEFFYSAPRLFGF